MRRSSRFAAAVLFSLALTQVGSVAIASGREEAPEEVLTSEEIVSSAYDASYQLELDGGCSDTDWAAVNLHCATNHKGCAAVTCSRVGNKLFYDFTCPPSPTLE